MADKETVNEGVTRREVIGLLALTHMVAFAAGGVGLTALGKALGQILFTPSSPDAAVPPNPTPGSQVRRPQLVDTPVQSVTKKPQFARWEIERGIRVLDNVAHIFDQGFLPVLTTNGLYNPKPSTIDWDRSYSKPRRPSEQYDVVGLPGNHLIMSRLPTGEIGFGWDLKPQLVHSSLRATYSVVGDDILVPMQFDATTIMVDWKYPYSRRVYEIFNDWTEPRKNNGSQSSSFELVDGRRVWIVIGRGLPLSIGSVSYPTATHRITISDPTSAQ